MATTYFEDNASSDINLNTVTAPATSKKLLQAAAGAASSMTITLASSATGVFAFISEPNDPSTSGGTGSRSYTVKWNVTTANANFIFGSLTAKRLNSAGVVQATSASLVGGNFTSTGVKTSTSAAIDVGTFAAGDRVALVFSISNSAMSSQSCVIEIGLANGNEEVTAPWTFSATPRSLPNTRAIDRLQHLITRATADCWRKRGGMFVPRLWTPADPVTP